MLAFSACSSIIISALSSAAALQSGLQRERVFLSGNDCVARYSGSRLYLLELEFDPGKAIFWEDTVSNNSVTYETDGKRAKIRFREGRARMGIVEGQKKNIDGIFARVFPFAHMKDAILTFIPIRNGDEQCEALVTLIEASPPEWYQGENDWIKSFVDNNMAAALELAKRHGRVEMVKQ
ncbi:hypothetical protein FOZ62_024587 [Perkinsus olseni]|uniref:Uncharacterized protein n=1 Tax=Perkinsus olseni TaxID=32597 RepID=A0A7J6TT93_PEROL|nr:hypothetical protein FOZ62_024587 [Perkinsus olseni]